jgi:hypothetical protein
VLKELHSGICAVSFPVRRIEMMIIDEGTEHDNSSMASDSFGKHVGSVCKRAVVCEWSWLSFRVGFDEITCHIWHALVYLISYIPPPSIYTRVQRVECAQTTKGLR